MRARIKELLEAGWTRRAIAQELGINPTTVTRHARLLGFSDVITRPSKFDWGAIQAYYDEGHTIDECRDKFDFSYGAWDKAVVRGDVVPRPRAKRELAHQTRDAVALLLAEGIPQIEVARRLGVSKSTVSYHCRRLGRAPDPRFARRYDWEMVQRAIDEEGLSMTRCRQRFGFCVETWRDAVRHGRIVPRPHVIPIDQLLVAGPRRSRGHIKARLLGAGLKENRCEGCGLKEWLGKPLGLELHHVNGDGCDNRLENLALLCGNCHAQTDNWGGRGIRRANRLDREAA